MDMYVHTLNSKHVLTFVKRVMLFHNKQTSQRIYVESKNKKTCSKYNKLHFFMMAVTLNVGRDIQQIHGCICFLAPSHPEATQSNEGETLIDGT